MTFRARESGQPWRGQRHRQPVGHDSTWVEAPAVELAPQTLRVPCANCRARSERGERVEATHPACAAVLFNRG